MSFDKSSLSQQRLDLIVEDLATEPGSLLDQVFPSTQTDRAKYTVDVKPSVVGLSPQMGKLAEGAEAQPRPASLATVTGQINGRYEGSFRFSEAERIQLERSNIRMEEYARQAQADCDHQVDRDLHTILGSGDYFQAVTRDGAAYTNVAAPFMTDILAVREALGRRPDLICIMGADVADAVRQLDDIKARLSNYSAGGVDDTELQAMFRRLGFMNLFIPNSYGKVEKDGQAAVTLRYNFDGLLWVGRPEAIYNVQLGGPIGRFGEEVSTSSYLLKVERRLDIRPVFEDSKLGGAFITAPLG